MPLCQRIKNDDNDDDKRSRLRWSDFAEKKNKMARDKLILFHCRYGHVAGFE